MTRRWEIFTGEQLQLSQLLSTQIPQPLYAAPSLLRGGEAAACAASMHRQNDLHKPQRARSGEVYSEGTEEFGLERNLRANVDFAEHG